MKSKLLPPSVIAMLLAAGALSASAEEPASDFGFQGKTDAYVLESVEPKYPHEMLQRGIEGETLLLLRVDTLGEVRDVRVISSTNKAFSKAAIKSAKNWYFQPGTLDGVPVPQTVTVPVTFMIEGIKTPALASL